MRVFKPMDSFLSSFSMLLVMSGCGGGGSSGGSETGPTASNVYINQDIVLEPQLSPSILQFSTTATGSISPSPKLKGPAGVAFIGLAVDGPGNLYVAVQFILLRFQARRFWFMRRERVERQLRPERLQAHRPD